MKRRSEKEREGGMKLVLLFDWIHFFYRDVLKCLFLRYNLIMKSVYKR